MRETLKNFIEELPESVRLISYAAINEHKWPGALRDLKPVGWDFMTIAQKKNNHLATQVFHLLGDSLSVEVIEQFLYFRSRPTMDYTLFLKSLKKSLETETMNPLSATAR